MALEKLVPASAALALVAQLFLLAALLRARRRLRASAASPGEKAAQLTSRWNELLTNVFLASRQMIALCPACHLGVAAGCLCDERKQRLALAVTAAEDFAAVNASVRPMGGNPA